MKTINIGINGMGRIGRTILRALIKRQLAGIDTDIQILAVNNPGDHLPYVHLLKYDSLHGKMPCEVKYEAQKLFVNGKTIQFFNSMKPTEIPWSDYKIDVVIDATGVFKDKAALSQHLKGSVKKVIMCAPGKDLDGTFVMGINHETYKPDQHHIISNASCTTNCLAPIVKVVNDQFGIENGFMTTVHAYTSDQNLLDNSHSDLRRSRAAAMSMIPTSTGAAKALGEVIPEMTGKLDGYAVRVPTPDVSMVDLTINLSKQADKKSINEAMKKASEGYLKGILGYTDEELVSIDFMGKTESSYFDSKLTNVIGKTAKIISWYDNEVGFSNRVLDLAKYIGQKF
jgi:glyceraldehyde-3-phosphate dehydrogenase type I